MQKIIGQINYLIKFGEEKNSGIENNENIILFHYSLNHQVDQP